MCMHSHSFLQFSTSASCLLFLFPSWFPSILASTDSAIPSCQCFLLQFPCTQADAFLAHPFTGWLSLHQFTAFDEVLQLSVHSISPSPSNPCSLPRSLLHI